MWQRSILGVIWKDTVTNEDVGVTAGLQRTENMPRKRRLCWLDYVIWMDHQHIPQKALYWD